LLSDPDRSGAIIPYGVADESDKRNISRPATVIVSPQQEEVFRSVGRDYADRPPQDDILDAVRSLGLPPTIQAVPQLGPTEAGPNAFQPDQMVPYYRGARFAANAMASRFPEAREEADAYLAQLDGYVEAAKELFRAKQQD